MLPDDRRAEPSFKPLRFNEVWGYLDEDPRDDPLPISGIPSICGRAERHLAGILQDPGHGTLFRLERALQRMPHRFDN